MQTRWANEMEAAVFFLAYNIGPFVLIATPVTAIVGAFLYFRTSHVRLGGLTVLTAIGAWLAFAGIQVSSKLGVGPRWQPLPEDASWGHALGHTVSHIFGVLDFYKDPYCVMACLSIASILLSFLAIFRVIRGRRRITSAT